MRILFVLIFFPLLLKAQDERRWINDLTSPTMFGRGYVRSGDSLAAEYIANEFKLLGLEKVNGKYFQTFTFSVNTFPIDPKITVDGKYLQAGKDYIPDPGSSDLCGTYDLYYFDKSILHNKKKLNKLNKVDFSKKIVVLDTEGFDEKLNKSSRSIKELEDMIKGGAFKNPGTIVIQDKLTFGASTFRSVPLLDVKRGVITPASKSIDINLKSVLKEYHQTRNVLGMVKGTHFPDSFLMVTAHYDHLGGIGSVFFPGANDNASGVAQLLNLAKRIKANPLKCSVIFIAFAGEEAGLIGSEYFVEHPLIPLKKIGFLINLDINGTGEEGIMVVNGTVHEKEFQKLSSIGTAQGIVAVKSRGKAAISDHFRFSEKDVPAFYIYTMGGSKAYHDIDDRPENLSLVAFEKITTMIYTYYSGTLK